jgi:hypothetical protein
MAVPTSAEVGMPVTVIFDGTSTGVSYGTTYPNSAAPVPVITNAQVSMEVKYVPTPGAADDA